MPAYDFSDRDVQYDAEEAGGSALLDGSGNSNDLEDSLAVPGGFTGKVGDSRGLLRSGDQHFRKSYAADNVWDIRGATSCTMAGWWYANNTEQHHSFHIDDKDATDAAGQALIGCLRETNSGGTCPWVFMGDGITRFVGASLKIAIGVTLNTGTWQFLAFGYDAVRNKLFGYWGRAVGESYYKEVDGIVGGFGYDGSDTETMMGKFNGEAGQAQSYVDHCLWWNGRALAEAELDIVWNDHAALSFDDLVGVADVSVADAGVNYYYGRP